MAAEDYTPEAFDEDDFRTATCKRCGKSNLRWEEVDGQWLLFEGQYKLHKCDPKRLHRAVADDFEVVK